MNGTIVSSENGFKDVGERHAEYGTGKLPDCNGNTSKRSLNVATAPDSDQAKLEAIEQTAAYLMSHTKQRPEIAIICGTGLGGIADKIVDVESFTYSQIPGFVASRVPGHAGRLVFGKLGDKCVVCMVGRNHFYEGHSMWQVTYPVRVFQRLGIRVLIVTNASGSLNPDYVPGDIMIIKDHISLPGMIGHNPLYGLSDERFGVRFLSMNDAYDWKLRKLLRSTAAELGLRGIREGVYVNQSGPTFETVAEIKMMRILGGDSVGMSTTPEVTVARHGLRPIHCVGLSLITNYGVDRYSDDDLDQKGEDSEHVNGCNGHEDASGTKTPPQRAMDHPDHATILKTAEKRAADLQQLVSTFLGKVDLTTIDD